MGRTKTKLLAAPIASLVLAACGSPLDEGNSLPANSASVTELPAESIARPNGPQIAEPADGVEKTFEFHVVTADGWEYDIAVTFPDPTLVLSKDITTSPPGKAELVSTMNSPRLMWVGTLQGRTAPDPLPQTRIAEFFDLGAAAGLDSDVGGLSSEGCTLYGDYLRCFPPYTTESDFPPPEIGVDAGWSEVTVDAIIASVNGSYPSILVMDLEGMGGSCTVRLFADGSVDNVDPYTQAGSKVCEVSAIDNNEPSTTPSP